jgi:predicted Rossmann fold flavoprotein
MQEIIFIFYARVFYTFSTVFNKVMNIVFIFAGKRIPNIRKMSELRKLKITEMNRLTVEEFKEVDKLPLVVVLDEVRSLHNIGAVFRTSDAFLVNCIYLCGITATPPHPEMHKTALGAEYTVDWKYFKRTQDAVNELHNDGRETDVERGELQLTEYGISGIPIFQLSRDVNYLLRDRKTVMAEIDFLPDMTEESYENMKKTRRMLQEKRTAEEFFTGILNKKLMSVFLKIAGIKPTTPAVEIPEDKINTFYELCRCFRLHITESNPYENAQVAAGGIAVTEVTEDMESKLCPGLYFAGEILDVDGRCGGYNLQWAWSSGFIAGCSAAIKTE